MDRFIELFNNNYGSRYLHTYSDVDITCDTIELDEINKDILKCIYNSFCVAEIDLNNNSIWFIGIQGFVRYQQGRVVIDEI